MSNNTKPMNFSQIKHLVDDSVTAREIKPGDILFSGGKVIIVRDVWIASGTIINGTDPITGRKSNIVSSVVDPDRKYTILNKLP